MRRNDKLWIANASVKLLIQYWVLRMLHLPPRSRGAFLLRDWGKDNSRFPGTHTHVLMSICRYRWPCAFPGIKQIKTSHFYSCSFYKKKKKRYKRHLITFVGFIWGDSCLSSSPIQDNNEEEMGWVCSSARWSFFY